MDAIASPPVYTTTALALMALFGFVGGLARGFSGFGSGLIFVPLASTIAGPQVAAPLLLLIDLVGSIPTIPGSWRIAEKRPTLIMLAGAMCGLPAGAFLLLNADPVPIRWGVCLTILGLLVLIVAGKRYRGRLTAPAFAAAGAVSGFLSGVAQVGGPPVVAFWLGSLRSPRIVRANIMFYMTLSGLLSLTVYSATGLMYGDVFHLGLFAAPGYVLGVVAGLRLHPVASPAFFRGVSIGLIFLAAVLGMPLLDHLL